MADARENELTQLGLIGLIPFVVAAFSVWLSPLLVPSRLAMDLREAAFIYAAVIVAHLAAFDGPRPAREGGLQRALLPGVIVLVVAVVAALPSGTFGLPFGVVARAILLIGAFLYLLMRDLRDVEAGVYAPWYRALRNRLTFWASISLAMIAARAMI